MMGDKTRSRGQRQRIKRKIEKIESGTLDQADEKKDGKLLSETANPNPNSKPQKESQKQKTSAKDKIQDLLKKRERKIQIKE